MRGSRAASGHFAACALRDCGNDRVLKLYRAEGPPGWQSGLARLHQEEVRAYQIAANDVVLRQHVPLSYGAEQVGQVFDVGGRDVGERYRLELGIVFERLNGIPVKLQEFSELPQHLVDYLNAFSAKGIYADDGSVFGSQNAITCKFIDLTTSLGNRLAGELIQQNAASPAELEAWFNGE